VQQGQGYGFLESTKRKIKIRTRKYNAARARLAKYQHNKDGNSLETVMCITPKRS
jgi:hypothetical protein